MVEVNLVNVLEGYNSVWRRIGFSSNRIGELHGNEERNRFYGMKKEKIVSD